MKKAIEKLEKYLERLFNGEKIKGFNLSPMEIYLLRDIYNEIVESRMSTFINENIKDVLQTCGFHISYCGIGWKVVL